MWVDDRTKVYTFTGQIFAEKAPGDDVYEVQIDRAIDACQTRD
jgi:AMMECR1 domain-containing protein